MNINNINKAIVYGWIIVDLSESNVLSWEEKYDAVFHISKKLREIGFEIDYCDPDTSYEDDVLALSRAASKHLIDWQEIASVKGIVALEEVL